MRSLLAIAMAARVAHADGAAEELSAGATVASAAPRTNWIADHTTGTWDASERWQVRLDLGATRSFPATIAAPPSDVMSAALAIELDPDAHWSVRGTAGWSPEVTSTTGATVAAGGLPEGNADVVVTATSSMASAGLAVGYDTAGASDFETSVSLSLGASFYTSLQEITTMVEPSGQMLTIQDVRDLCGATACSGELRAALWPQWTQLAQFVADVNVTETVQRDTDVGIDAAYYTYDEDPTRVGYFALATVGRGNLGAGVAVAPLDVTLAPSIAHRFDALMVTGSLSYGSYVDDLGYDVTAALRVQYKLKLDDGKRLKLHTVVSGAWDMTSGELSAALTFAAGAAYSW
jgi:hypothetical protein